MYYYSIFHERQPNGHELTLKSELYAAWRASSRRRESGCQDSFRTCVAHGPISSGHFSVILMSYRLDEIRKF